MQLTRPKHALFADDIFGGIKHHGIEFDRVGVPVGFAFFNRDTSIQTPFCEFEGAVTDNICDPGPLGETVGGLAKFFQRWPVHREGTVVIH